MLPLEELYRRIDSSYSQAAEQVGFSCHGCDGEKCCTVDLTLHTFVETAYLLKGVEMLEPRQRFDVIQRSMVVLAAKSDDPAGPGYRNAPCVLNVNGLCSVYDYRPMICRLAGIPHQFRRPDGTTREAGGCPRYEAEILPLYPHLRIDRTPFYRDMAEIEIKAVRTAGRRAPSRTIAEIIANEVSSEA
ncbi:MAG: YkgJ family cysteine cluster protein [Desulfomonile sp.]|nr:YkgJ family cysteine cluster protein [Desulfomonile sp.]